MLSNISAQTHLLPISIILVMGAIGIELRVGHFVALIAKPKIPILGTLVHTFTLPVIAAILVAAIVYFDWALSESLLIGILLIAQVVVSQMSWC